MQVSRLKREDNPQKFDTYVSMFFQFATIIPNYADTINLQIIRIACDQLVEKQSDHEWNNFRDTCCA